MKYSVNFKLVVFAPVEAADAVRDAIHRAGAGNVGSYTRVSYSSQVLNRYTPEKSADPTIGESTQPQIVAEERMEFLCPKELLGPVIAAMKKAHPYEAVAYDVLERIDA